MVCIDMSPMGMVLDLHLLPDQEAAAREAADIIHGGAFHAERVGGILKIVNCSREVALRVESVMGGNQWNILSNLRVLNERFPEAGVVPEAVFSAGDEFQRWNLFLPGDRRLPIRLPTVRAHHFPEALDQRVVISAAELDAPDSPQWNWVRQRSEEGGEWYWCPGRNLLDGNLLPETLDALKGRLAVFQLNEHERGQWEKAYGALPPADWTVTTLEHRGAELIAPGVSRIIPATAVPEAENIFGKHYRPRPVGCGDAFLASLIFAREAMPEVDPVWGAQFASRVAGVQFQHGGSNLSSVRELLLARRELIPYDFKHGVSH